MLNRSLLRIRDPGEVHALIRSEDEMEVLRRLDDEPLPVRHIGGQYAFQFLLKLHLFIMALAGILRSASWYAKME